MTGDVDEPLYPCTVFLIEDGKFSLDCDVGGECLVSDESLRARLIKLFATARDTCACPLCGGGALLVRSTP